LNPPFDFDAAFRAIAQDGSRMVLVLSGPTFGNQHAHIADLAMQHQLPTMFIFQVLCRSRRTDVLRYRYGPNFSPRRVVCGKDS
jgi:hypothetical protein